MSYIQLIAEHRVFITMVMTICAAICQYLQYRHVKDGRCARGDTGYFWRLWRQGDNAGKVMIYLTMVGVAMAILLIISSFAEKK
jgi:hypothetical protein